MQNFVLISGCSGGGKSTLLDALARRGHAVVPEPGWRIIAEQRSQGGSALPWVDPIAFVRRAIDLSLADRAEASGEQGWVFFDCGLIDAAAALEYLTGQPVVSVLDREHRYHHRVFLAPPWPEIYFGDTDRRHGLIEAVAEYERLAALYPRLDYDTVMLPRNSVEDRADFMLATLAAV